MASQQGSGFRYTPPGGSLTTHPAKLRLRAGVAAHVQTRYRNVALDQRTIDVVTIDGGAEEIEGTIRFDDAGSSLLTMLRHGADGVILSYYPDLEAADFYPFAVMTFGEAVEINADTERFFNREWERTIRLRRVDGGSLANLVAKNLILNAGFEDSSSSFAPHHTIASGGAWTVSDNGPRSGGRSARYDPTGQTTAAFLILNGPLSTLHEEVRASGEPFHLLSWVRAEDAGDANRVRVNLVWLDAVGAPISAEDGNSVTPTQAHQSSVASGIAPPSAAYVAPRIEVISDGHTTNALLIDDPFFRRGPA